LYLLGTKIQISSQAHVFLFHPLPTQSISKSSTFYFHTAPNLTPPPLLPAGHFPSLLSHHITRGREEGQPCSIHTWGIWVVYLYVTTIRHA
jgi:hypothetical protein